MALPIGATYLKMYAELGLFLAVWPVLMAVYNYIDDLIVKNKFTYASTMGYSLNSAHSFNMLVGSQLGWMGYLSWGVPMMAYALVSGSTYAMVGAISSMDSAGKSAAATGANVASTGNLSLGNISTENYKANSVAADIAPKQGRGLNTKISGYAQTTTPLGGGPTIKSVNKPGVESSGFTSNGTGSFDSKGTGLKQGFTNDALTSASDSTGIMGTIKSNIVASKQKDYTNARANERVASSQLSTTLSNMNAFMTSKGSGVTGAEKRAYNTSGIKAFDKTILNDKKLTATEQHELMARFSAGMNEGAGPLSAGLEAIQQLKLGKGVSSDLTNSFKHNFATNITQSGGLEWGKNSTKNAALSHNISAVASSNEAYSQARKQTQSSSKKLTEAKTVSGDVTQPAILRFYQHYDKQNGFTKANKFSASQIARKNNAFQARLNSGDKSALLTFTNFVANNPAIVKREQAVNNARKTVSKVPPKPSEVAAINRKTTDNAGIVKSHNPYKYAPPPSAIKQKIQKLETPAAKVVKAFTTSKKIPFDKLSPKEQKKWENNDVKKNVQKIGRAIGAVSSAIILGSVYDVIGQSGKAEKLVKNALGYLPKIPTFNPQTTQLKYHPEHLKITNPKLYQWQKQEYNKLSGKSGPAFGKIQNTGGDTGPGTPIMKNINSKIKRESPLPNGNNIPATPVTPAADASRKPAKSQKKSSPVARTAPVSSVPIIEGTIPEEK